MRLARVAVVALTLGAVAFPFAPARADTVEDKQRQAAALADRIDRLQDEAEMLAEDYNLAVLELAGVERDVESAKLRLTRQEAELATLRSQVAGAALRSYVHADDTTGIAGLLDPATLSGEGAGRNGYAAVAIGSGLELADTTRAKIEDTERQRAALDAEQQRREQLATTAAAKREAVDAATGQAEQALEQVKGDLVELVAAEEQRRLAEAAARQQAELERVRIEAAEAAEAARAAAEAATTTEPAASSSSSGAPAAAPSATAGRPSTVQPPTPRSSTTRATTAPRPAAAAPRPAATAAPKPPAAPPVVRPVPAPSPGAAGAVAAAMSQVGGRYVAYQSSPATGFDCSGLTMWAWAQAGVRLPHQSRAQFASLPKVPIDQLQPGDLVFIGNPIHHVGMYVGGGQMVHAASPRWGIIVSPIHDLVGAARPG